MIHDTISFPKVESSAAHFLEAAWQIRPAYRDFARSNRLVQAVACLGDGLCPILGSIVAAVILFATIGLVS
jgi:hypothetical protein